MVDDMDEVNGLLQRIQVVLPAIRHVVESGAPSTTDDDLATRGTATDGTGSVRVVLDRAGIPETFELDPQWRHRVGAQGFAAAVTDACRRAAQARSEVISREQAAHAEQLAQLGSLMAYLGGDGDPPAALPRRPPTAGTAPSAEAMTAWMLQLTERLTATLDAAGGLDSVVRSVMHAQSGHAGAGRLTLTLAPTGTLTCQADPDWVGSRDTGELARALASALSAIRSEREAVGNVVSDAAAVLWKAPPPTGEAPADPKSRLTASGGAVA